MADLAETTKSYWNRPEGKTGLLVLGGVGAALFYGWGKIVPFIATTIHDTFYMACYTLGLVGLVYLVFSPRTHLFFRLITRAITGVVIELDPIGILKDRLSQMRKRRDEMQEQIQKVSGQVRVLKDTMKKNEEAREAQMRQAMYAKKSAAEMEDVNAQLRRELQVKVKANKAGRLERANMSYQQLLVKLQAVYDLLTRLDLHVEAYIEDAEDTVRQKEIEHKTIGSAYKAFKAAMRVLKGNRVEEDVYNQTMEYLADEASKKLGEMEDMQRFAASFMDNLDVENGAITEKALNELAQYEQKFLTPGADNFLKAVPAAKQVVPMATQRRPSSDARMVKEDDYKHLFGKEDK